jgi:predicted nucleic acid-binding protein
MSAKLEFVDTNVLLYAYDHTEPKKQAKAAALLADLWKRRVGCLSLQVLQEFFVNVTRKLSRPLEVVDAYQIVHDYSLWIVHVPNTSDVTQAIDLHERYQVSFWDAMILQSALELGCSTLWSEDLNAGQAFEALTVRSPF